MSRLLLLVVIIIVVYWLIKSYQRRLPKDDGGENVPGQAEDMVLCAHCGVHLPKRESILTRGKFYCSEAHRRAHTGKPGSP